MSAELQLVLVDVDNVIHTERWSGPLPEPAVAPEADIDWLRRRGRVPAPDPAVAPAVVVFALNLETAHDPAMTFAGLQRWAVALASVLANASLRGFEVALTLPAKQSADKALERLLEEAPRPDHAGALRAVHVLTHDKGLRASLEARLGRKYAATRHDVARVGSWTLASAKGAHRRRPPREAPPGLASVPESPSDPHVAIDTEALAIWAATQTVGLPATQGLDAIVGHLRSRLGLLTQIGLTTTSVRGLARLHALAHGTRPSLGPCSHDEGLERCDLDVAPGRARGASASPLGPGALRLREPGVTVGTSLPPGLCEMSEGPFLVGLGGAHLDDDTVLRRLAAARNRLLSMPRFEVQLTCGDRGLKAVITSPYGVPLPAWGRYAPRGAKNAFLKTWSDLAVDGIRLESPFTVEAVVDVRPDRSLGTRVPYGGPVTVDVPQPIPRGTIGRGTVNGEPVAVLGPPSPRAPGPWPCDPIQALSGHQLRLAGVPPERATLTHLPILVPR